MATSTFISHAGSGDAHTTAFASLQRRRLPWGFFHKLNPLVFHGDEHAIPVEGAGPHLHELIDNVIYVIESKAMGDVHFWKCSDETSPRPLLLVDRRVGFGRRVWCLLDFSRPGRGDDVNVKLHQLFPRSLDFLDWTLLRYLGFLWLVFEAVTIAASSFSSQPAKEREYKQGQSSAALLLLTFVVGTFFGIAYLFIEKTTLQHAVWPTVSVLAIGMSLSFLLYVFEAKEPLTDMQRYSTELMLTVQLALQTATITMPRVQAN